MNRRLIAGLFASVLTAGIVASRALGDDLVDSNSGTVVLNKIGAQLSPEAANEMKGMAPGAAVVECAPGVPQLPAGVTPSRSMRFVMSHPGFAVLADGHCVYDVTAKPAAPAANNVDRP